MTEDPTPPPAPSTRPAPVPPADPKPAPPPVKLPASQEELDRIVGDRLARERAKFADYDDLKRKAAAHDKALEAAKSEHEKGLDAARKEGAAAVAAAANARLVAAEARALAAAGAWRVSPAAVVRQLDLSAVKVADDGTVDTSAIETALAALATAEPGLVADPAGANPRPPASFGGGARPAPATKAASLEDAVLSRMTKS